jgi:MYXO-CTERM domain-containing protein
LRRTAAAAAIAALLLVGLSLYGAVQAAPAVSNDGGLGIPAGSVAATATSTPETPIDTPTPSPTPRFPIVFAERQGDCAIVNPGAGEPWPLLMLLALLALRRRSA